MFSQRPTPQLRERIASLQSHLKEENPVLVDTVGNFQELDKVAYALGLLNRDESFATSVTWWPMIAVLGTFSAGKSTFINELLGARLQKTGNQAVDDRFTVLTYSNDPESRMLPGLSLNADPRFPFYQISTQIEAVADGEGGRINSYLQLKTTNSNMLRGKIIIDSPGFDADEQRSATLRITDHIIDLSDLVLVLFDARRPEPGAMHDTLEHLVRGTVQRNDADKVLFILNQLDVTAPEDNFEDVVSAWQRAVAKGGLSSARFYTIYNETAANPIDDEELKRRFKHKRDADVEEIYQRIADVSVERVYRVVGSLETTANEIEYNVVPLLRNALERWYRRVMTLDLVIIVPILVVLFGLSIWAGDWQGLSFSPPWGNALGAPWITGLVLCVLIAGGIIAIHYWIRGLVARRIAGKLRQAYRGPGKVAQAFLKNTRYYMSIFSATPAGWNRKHRNRLARVREAADGFVQKLNDRYANPTASTARSEAHSTPAQEQESI